MLANKEMGPELIAKCAREAMAASKPMDDQRAKAWYRIEAGTVLLRRALTEAAGLNCIGKCREHRERGKMGKRDEAILKRSDIAVLHEGKLVPLKMVVNGKPVEVKVDPTWTLL